MDVLIHIIRALLSSQVQFWLIYCFAHAFLFGKVCAVLQERSKSVEVELESFANSPVFCTVKQKSTAPKSSETYIYCRQVKTRSKAKIKNKSTVHLLKPGHLHES